MSKSNRNKTCPVCGKGKSPTPLVCGTCWDKLPEQSRDQLLNAHWDSKGAFEQAVFDAQAVLCIEFMDNFPAK